MGIGAEAAVGRAQQHPVLEWSARMGFAVYGLVYVVIAWLAAQLVLGDGGGTSVSRTGALHELAQQPLGSAVLWVTFVGFVALVIWEAMKAVVGHWRYDGLRKVAHRAGSAARAVIFAGFAVSTARVALGRGGSSSGTDSWTARLMRLPGGPVIVGAVGVGIVGYAVFSAYKGLSDRWRKDLDTQGRVGRVGRAITVAARVGYAGRGVAFAVIGCLFVWAAMTHDARKSGGLDQALGRLRHAPLGPVLLGAVAVGLACYGIFNIAKARHLRDA